jgi:hypothetical protein
MSASLSGKSPVGHLVLAPMPVRCAADGYFANLATDPPIRLSCARWGLTEAERGVPFAGRRVARSLALVFRPVAAFAL